MSRKLKFLLLQVYTKEISNYARISFEINLDYCLRHGYGFRVADVGYLKENNIHPSWGKVYETLFDLTSAADYDYVWTLDADAVVVNPDQTLTAIVQSRPDALMYVSENGLNGGNLFNCGSFIIKKSKESADILRRAFAEGIKTAKRNEMFWEQSILNEMCESDLALRQAVNVLPMRAINSFWKDGPEDCPFVWHLMNGGDFKLTERRLSDYLKAGHTSARNAGRFARVADAESSANERSISPAP